MAFTQAQRQQAIGLYKRVLRTSRHTFQGDGATASAWRLQVRDQFKAASQETDPAKIDEGLHMWEEIISVLRHNVVQGQYKDDSNAFHLKFTPDTELGSNESIKLGRQKQMEELRANKGIARCGASTSTSTSPSSSSSSSPSSARQYSTSAISRAAKFALSAKLPRPAPQFPQTVFFSDGSSIQLTTTSPRSVVRLTRDPTNHPLWNPSLERKGSIGNEDESGRLGRFRKRFGGAEEALQDGESQKPSAAAMDSGFSGDQLDWMSIGGREARAGSQAAVKKGKGKK